MGKTEGSVSAMDFINGIAVSVGGFFSDIGVWAALYVLGAAAGACVWYRLEVCAEDEEDGCWDWSGVIVAACRLGILCSIGFLLILAGSYAACGQEAAGTYGPALTLIFAAVTAIACVSGAAALRVRGLRAVRRRKKAGLSGPAGDWRERMWAAQEGHALDVLAEDPDWRVRLAVANQGHALDTLAADPEPWVRAEVADQGHALDVLAGDPSEYVRAAVAARRRVLDTAKDDPDADV